MISGSGSFGTINILLVYVLFFFVFIDDIFQRSPFMIVSNKYNLLSQNMRSALFRLILKQLIPKDCTQTILKVFVKINLQKNPKIILSRFIQGGAGHYVIISTLSIKTEWIDVSVQEFVTYDRRASKDLCKILVILYITNVNMNKYSDWILSLSLFYFTILPSSLWFPLLEPLFLDTTIPTFQQFSSDDTERLRD